MFQVYYLTAMNSQSSLSPTRSVKSPNLMPMADSANYSEPPILPESCIGCLREFQEGETLPPEGIHIEYKNYYLPVREHQQRWILLKTIVAFLNSKGGAIYMGVDDATREVVGVVAELKEQDQFMLELGPLLDQIQPAIDLRHREEVRVQFVPVLKNKTFQGRYIIKIIVKQGDPSKLYHFAQTLRFHNEDRRHHEEDFQVLWGFYRSNMGKVDSIRGTDLLKEVYDKAKHPLPKVEAFHQGCHPQPRLVAFRNMNIGFKYIPADDQRKFTEFLQEDLKSSAHLINGQNYTLQVLIPNQMSTEAENVGGVEKTQKEIASTVNALVKFVSITDFKLADMRIQQNIDQYSNCLCGNDKLVDVGVIEHTHFYKFGMETVKLKYGKAAERAVGFADNDQRSRQRPSKSRSRSRRGRRSSKSIRYVEKDKSAQKGNGSSDKRNNIVPILPKPPIKNDSPIKKNDRQLESNKQKASRRAVSVYEIKIRHIHDKSLKKAEHFLSKSLRKQLSSIPHKVLTDEDQCEVAIGFSNERDLLLFCTDFLKDQEIHRVIKSFGEQHHPIITVVSGSKQKQIYEYNHKFNIYQKSASDLENQQKKGYYYLVLSNFKADLTTQEQKRIKAILLAQSQNELSKSTLLEINLTNFSTPNPLVTIKVESYELLQLINESILNSLTKDHDFTKFFQKYRIVWGVPNGSIMTFHYDKAKRTLFKKEVERLLATKQSDFNSSISIQFLKAKDVGYYLQIKFKPKGVDFESQKVSSQNSGFQEVERLSEAIGLIFEELALNKQFKESATEKLVVIPVLKRLSAD